MLPEPIQFVFAVAVELGSVSKKLRHGQQGQFLGGVAQQMRQRIVGALEALAAQKRQPDLGHTEHQLAVSGQLLQLKLLGFQPGDVRQHGNRFGDVSALASAAHRQRIPHRTRALPVVHRHLDLGFIEASLGERL